MTTVQLEDIDAVKKRVIFEVPFRKLQDAMDAQYRDLRKTVQLKGFRRGKVPISILRSYFKDKVEADATRAVIEETFESGLAENNINPVSILKVEPEAVEQDKPFKYVAEIEVPPPVELKEYKGLELTRFLREPTEEEVDERLQTLRETHSRLSPLPEGRGVREGDQLTVDVTATVDGEPLERLTVTDYGMELGRDFFVPGFDEKITGMLPDDTKKITLDLPEDFPAKDLKGKTVDFEVTIKEAKERVLPELDDDFAKDLGDHETLEQLKESIRKNIQELHDMETRREVENQLVDRLVEEHEVQAPESMVEQQISRALDQTREQLARFGVSPDDMPAPTQEQRDRLRPSAERTVKAGLILQAVGEKEGIEVSDEELEKAIEKRAEELGYPVEDLKDLLEEHNMLREIKSNLLQEKTVEFVLENADVTERTAPEGDEEPNEQTEKE
jgi:trigger factor